MTGIRIRRKRGNALLDLYQIFMEYNRAWTLWQIIFFSIIFIIAAGVSYLLWYHKKILLSQVAAGLLLVFFLGIVFGATVFTRETNPYRNYELELFWSWKEVYHGSRVALKEILLNCVLLLPMGVLLPVALHRKLSWWKGLLAGVFISVIIEVCQLILCRGLFEWDDMIHNGIGCMVGCMISGRLVKSYRGG